MDIIFVCDGKAYAMHKTKGYCCGPGWVTDDCMIHRRILCDTELCAGSSSRTLEKSLGHHIGWRYLGNVPTEETHMYVVDLGEAFEVVQRERPNETCQKQCSVYGEGVCDKYCSSRGSEAICIILGDAIGVSMAVFRRIK